MVKNLKKILKNIKLFIWEEEKCLIFNVTFLGYSVSLCLVSHWDVCLFVSYQIISCILLVACCCWIFWSINYSRSIISLYCLLEIFLSALLSIKLLKLVMVVNGVSMKSDSCQAIILFLFLKFVYIYMSLIGLKYCLEILNLILTDNLDPRFDCTM